MSRLKRVRRWWIAMVVSPLERLSDRLECSASGHEWHLVGGYAQLHAHDRLARCSCCGKERKLADWEPTS